MPGLGLAGGLAGNVIGRAFKTESWERVPIDELWVSLRPGGDFQLAIVLGLRF